MPHVGHKGLQDRTVGLYSGQKHPSACSSVLNKGCTGAQEMSQGSSPVHFTSYMSLCLQPQQQRVSSPEPQVDFSTCCILKYSDKGTRPRKVYRYAVHICRASHIQHSSCLPFHGQVYFQGWLFTITVCPIAPRSSKVVR